MTVTVAGTRERSFVKGRHRERDLVVADHMTARRRFDDRIPVAERVAGGGIDTRAGVAVNARAPHLDGPGIVSFRHHHVGGHRVAGDIRVRNGQRENAVGHDTAAQRFKLHISIVR